MKNFIDRDFLLESETARSLYHNVAADLPVIDCHSPFSAREMSEDKRYSNITELWLYCDPEKQRAMRLCGVDEKNIGGVGSDFEKFREYCRIMPSLAGNQLYHLSHIELKRLFDCDLIINEKNCETIWKHTSDVLAKQRISARGLLESSGVVLTCVSADPAEPLDDYKTIAESGCSVKVIPTFCPDEGMNISRRGISEYFLTLGREQGVAIRDLDTLCEAYVKALDSFEGIGCRSAEHKIDGALRFVKPDKFHAEQILKKAILNDGEGITEEEEFLWIAQMLRFLGDEYRRRGWVMQLHYGTVKNLNSRFRPRSGFEIIQSADGMRETALLFDYLSGWEALPHTVLYPANQSDTVPLVSLCASFAGVVQASPLYGGVESYLKDIASVSSLGCSLGASVDMHGASACAQHEYFRRIFCNFLGNLVECGLYPDDLDALRSLVRGVCFENVQNLYGFEF